MKNEVLETIFTIILYALAIGLLITVVRFLQNDWPSNIGTFVIAQSSLIALAGMFKFIYARKATVDEKRDNELFKNYYSVAT